MIFLAGSLITPEFGLLFWQFMIFLVILFILGKFAWKPILTSLKEREANIEEALNAAKKAKEEMQKLHADNDKLLQEARLERDKMLREAQTAANNIVSEAKDKATAEGQRLIENARAAINNEKQAALTEVKNLAANLSLEIAEKILKRELADEKAQKELVNEFIKEANLN
ncbi:MAG: F0F1 ATP synthase subunit B [Cytophagaceae bacterium]|nr:F0F1 ATP synthase subunit B [Cytophagaceae bacterium]